MARGHGVCERPLFTGSNWETQISQSCCDCCTLGLKMDSMGFICDFQDLQLDKQCSDAAKVRCQKPKDITPSAKGQEELKVLISRPPDEPNTCRELNCSQLCVGNGRRICNDGFRLKRDGVTCEDIDECAVGSHNCGAGFDCVNTPGSFYCDLKVVCRDGFTLDASGKCIDIDECMLLTNPCRRGQSCVNAVGSYVCLGNPVVCPQGHRPTADRTRCEDVDECLVANVCGSRACVNLDGSYRCECRAGYRLSNVTEACEDVNECKYYSWRLCGHI